MKQSRSTTRRKWHLRSIGSDEYLYDVEAGSSELDLSASNQDTVAELTQRLVDPYAAEPHADAARADLRAPLSTDRCTATTTARTGRRSRVTDWTLLPARGRSPRLLLPLTLVFAPCFVLLPKAKQPISSSTKPF